MLSFFYIYIKGSMEAFLALPSPWPRDSAQTQVDCNYHHY